MINICKKIYVPQNVVKYWLIFKFSDLNADKILRFKKKNYQFYMNFTKNGKKKKI